MTQLRYTISLALVLWAGALFATACDDSVSCDTDEDCFAGEVCYEGNCAPDPGGDAGNNANNGTDDGGGDDGGNDGPQVVEVSAGGLSTCARFDSGELRCWGRNLEGQLGHGDTSNQETSPVTVENMTDAVELESGHSNHCSFTGDGKVYCWGSNTSEQITPEQSVDKIDTPTDLGVTSVASLGLASSSICVLLEGNGGLSCLGTDTDAVVYALPDFSEMVESLGAGFHHACAVMANGDVECWGQDDKGEVGGSGPIDNLPSVAKVAAGNQHTCAMTDSGTVYCWGSNESGQLGVGADQNPDEAVRVEGLDQIVDIDAGFSHTCALDSDGAVVCWGSDTEGFFQPLPTGIFGLNEGVEKISVGSYHACALRSSGGVVCWGRGLEGQLGHGELESSSRPVQVEF